MVLLDRSGGGNEFAMQAAHESTRKVMSGESSRLQRYAALESSIEILEQRMEELEAFSNSAPSGTTLGPEDETMFEEIRQWQALLTPAAGVAEVEQRAAEEDAWRECEESYEAPRTPRAAVVSNRSPLPARYSPSAQLDAPHAPHAARSVSFPQGTQNLQENAGAGTGRIPHHSKVSIGTSQELTFSDEPLDTKRHVLKIRTAAALGGSGLPSRRPAANNSKQITPRGVIASISKFDEITDSQHRASFSSANQVKRMPLQKQGSASISQPTFVEEADLGVQRTARFAAAQRNGDYNVKPSNLPQTERSHKSSACLSQHHSTGHSRNMTITQLSLQRRGYEARSRHDCLDRGTSADTRFLTPAEHVLQTEVAAQLSEMAALRAENCRLNDQLVALGVPVRACVQSAVARGYPFSSPRGRLQFGTASPQSCSLGGSASDQSLQLLHAGRKSSRSPTSQVIEVGKARPKVCDLEATWVPPSRQIGTLQEPHHGMGKARHAAQGKPALYTRPGSWKAGDGAWSPVRPSKLHSELATKTEAW